jgi:hypothetical protein
VPATAEEEGGMKVGTTKATGSTAAKVEPVNNAPPLFLKTVAMCSAFTGKQELVGTLLFKEVKPKLLAFNLAEANESGTEDVWLENDEPWGVQVF